MKKVFVLLALFLFSSLSVAKPIGFYHVRGKILSFDKKFLTVSINRKKIRLPRNVIKDKKIQIGSERDLLLTKQQFTLAQLQFLKRKK